MLPVCSPCPLQCALPYDKTKRKSREANEWRAHRTSVMDNNTYSPQAFGTEDANHVKSSSGEAPPHVDDTVVAPRVVRRERIRSFNMTRACRAIREDYCLALRCPSFTLFEHTHTPQNMTSLCHDCYCA
jgi:hypothetical protein